MSIRTVFGGVFVVGVCLALGVAFLWFINQLLGPVLFAVPFCRFWLWTSLSVGAVWTGWHCRRRAMLHGVMMGLTGLFLVLLAFLWFAPALLPQKPGWDLALLFLIAVVGGAFGEAFRKRLGPYWQRWRTSRKVAPPAEEDTPEDDTYEEEISPKIEE